MLPQPSNQREFLGITLSELAFILFFTILLLALWRLWSAAEETEKWKQTTKTAQDLCDSLGSEDDARCVEEILEKLREMQRLHECSDESCMRRILIEASTCTLDIQLVRAENAELRSRLEALERRLAALEALAVDFPELRAALDGDRDLEALLRAALECRAGGEGEDIGALQRRIQELEDQVAELIAQVNDLIRRGHGLPSCWYDDEGEIQYVFLAVIRNDNVTLSRLAPASRESDYQELQSVSELTAAEFRMDEFGPLGQWFLDYGKRQNPECRFYVVIDNISQPPGVGKDEMIREVLEYFYPYWPQSLEDLPQTP